MTVLDVLFLLQPFIWFLIGRWSRGNNDRQEQQIKEFGQKLSKTVINLVDRDHPSSGVIERPTAADLKAREPQHQKEVEAWQQSLGPNFGKKNNNGQ